MIEDIVSFFENDDELPTYNKIRGAYVDIGEGFSEKLLVETELKVALVLDSKSKRERDYYWNNLISRWKKRWSSS
jgi:hypothetical protein